MEALQIFNYNETPVTFKNENGVIFLSATEMAKPFGKRPNDYLTLQSTTELLYAITRKNGIAENQVVETVRGGLNPGTWFHEDIALDFAQWLSIDFKLWCNDRIKELLRTGVTTVSNDDEVIAQAMLVLNSRLEAARQEKQRLQYQNDLQLREIAQAAPKAEYFDTVLQSKTIYLADQIAKELGMTAMTMNKRLKEMKVLFKRGEQWVLTDKYCGKGYTGTNTYSYTKHSGETGTSMLTVWTEKGRLFIHELFKSN